MSSIALREVLLLGGSLAAGYLISAFAHGLPGVRRFSAGFERGLALPTSAALLAIALTVYTWGNGLAPLPRVSDEAAYLFQAEVFASGRWTAPAPVLPEFFEQWHVQMTPARAAKYLPGHSLLLALGAAIGLPALVPILFTGGTAWLIVVLARGLAGGGVALLAWALWMGSDLSLRWRPSYFAQSTTTFLFLATVYALMRWRRGQSPGWLLVVGLSISWTMITRPVTGVALAMPVLGFIAWTAWSRGRIKTLLYPAILGGLVISLLPLWAARTTGSSRDWPLTRYTTDYLPFDRTGLRLDSSPPRRALPPAMQPLADGFRQLHVEHNWDTLPETARLRAGMIVASGWNAWRRWTLPAFLVGLLLLPGPGLMAIGITLTHFGIYLTYAHPLRWTLYYSELAPLFAFFTALGLLRLLAFRRRRAPSADERGFQTRQVILALMLIPLIAMSVKVDARRGRALRQHTVQEQHPFHQAIESLPDPRAIVFVRSSPGQFGGDMLIKNDLDLETARVWVVHDLGAANSRLLSRAPDRAAYFWEVGAQRLLPYPGAQVP